MFGHLQALEPKDEEGSGMTNRAHQHYCIQPVLGAGDTALNKTKLCFQCGRQKNS